MKASNGRKQKNKELRTVKRKTSGQILPALVAVGGACGLATAPVSALELGEINIDSHLGQPLRARIAYALSPNEQMFDFCIFLKPGNTANGMPNVSKARITITDKAIILDGRTSIREPLLAMQLSVNCPYTAHLARDYTLMIDPATSTDGELVALRNEAEPLTPVQMSTVTATDVASEPKPTPSAPPSARPQDDSPIAMSSRYLVQTGDSLSQIASRIENRTVALWPAVAEIFAANPDAFLDNDPDLLKAGSWLVIPDLIGGSVTATATATTTAPQTTAAPDATSSVSYSGVTVAETAAVPAPAEVAETAAVAAEAADPAPVLQAEPVPVAETVTPELRPGDFIVGTDSPFVVPVGADEIIDIRDIAIDGPRVSQPVPAIVSGNKGDGSSSGWSWLMWLGGAGLALILGLLLFGRQIRQRFGSVAVGAPPMPSRRSDDRAAPQPAVIADTEYELEDDTLNSQSITLDADLGSGSGLQDASDMDVAQDFGFSAPSVTITQVDLEISEQPSREEEQQPTDIIPPSEQQKETILENEIMPTDETGSQEYDLSMMVDATKHILEDDNETAKDLMAVALDTDDDTKANYQILEQDYEDELTATQALNQEIEEAARALVERMDEVDVSIDTAEMPMSEEPELTAEMPMSEEPELTAEMPMSEEPEMTAEMPMSEEPELTAEMPMSEEPELTAEMPTSENSEITAELTAKLTASGDAQNEDFDDSSVIIPELTVETIETAEMPLPDSDATIEVESGSIDTKKSKAS